MKLELPQIYPITDTRISGLSHVEQVERLIEGGATFIQLRDKHAPSGEFYRAAVAAIEVARSHSVKIIINDRVDIALAAGADGVHLGQDDLSPIEARTLLGKDAIIGFSTHSEEQASAALGLPVDYIAFGPVFPTTTKERADDVVGLEKIRNIQDIVQGVPLVGIGGIDRTNINSVLSSGVDSAAVISAVLRDPGSISKRLAQLLNALSIV